MNFQCCAKNSKEATNISNNYIFLRAISDPNRLKILCLLKQTNQCVCEIAPKIGISVKLASHHLGQLKKVGLLSEEREGNFIRYGLNKKILREYKKNFNQTLK